jgi:hypothetical protein
MVKFSVSFVIAHIVPAVYAVAEAEPPAGPVCPAGQKSVNRTVMRNRNLEF